MATKAAREITVLNRYEIKEDYAPKGLHKGDVVLHIRNDKGVEYYTTLRRNKVHSCNCKAVKPCYHIKQMVVKENARFAAKVAKPVEQTPVQASPLREWVDNKISTAELVKKTTLTRNAGFQMMR